MNTILKLESNVNSNVAEKILGHKNGLDGVYLAPTRQECFEEFVKGISQLTISESERQKITISNLKKENNDLTDLKQQLAELQEFKEQSQAKINELQFLNRIKSLHLQNGISPIIEDRGDGLKMHYKSLEQLNQ